MKEHEDGVPTLNLSHERQAWRSRFLTRFGRYRSQLQRRWWVLLLGVAIGTGVEAVLWRFAPTVYVSCGRMIVNLKLSIPEGSLYTEELNNFLGTQTALMQSAAVVGRARDLVAARLIDPEDQPVSLKALIQPRTTIFVLQGTGCGERYTQAFVQACMEEYIALKKEMRAQTSDTTLAGMTEEAVRLEKELRKCDEDLVAFCSSNNTVSLLEQGNGAANYVAELNQHLASLKSELGLMQVLSLDQNLDRAHGAAINPTAPHQPLRADASGLADSDYLHARQQLLLLKSERDDLARDLRPKHPKLIALSEEIGRRERLLEIFREQTAEQMETHKETLRLQIANLENEVKDWDVRSLDSSRRGAEFQRLKASGQRNQALYDRLLATMQTLDVNKQISPESVTIMEKASASVPEHPGLLKKTLLGSVAGLVGSLLLLLLLDRLDDRVGSFSELQELFDEEVLAQIPRERSALLKGSSGLLQPLDERYGFVESYRSLRSSLLYMSGAGQRPKTLLVTSSVPNEGKSLTSANLAITLASSGAKVLLVDADLRKGSLHNRFGLSSPVPGLSEALHEEGSVNLGAGASLATQAPGARSNLTPNLLAAIQPTRLANLFLLPRGEATHLSSELFVNAAANRFLQQARAHYDFVVLDTAPVMAADDVTSLAPHVDGVVFVVRAGQSSARVARAALDLLYLRHVRVLGLVFNAIRPSSADYYCYYKYKDYHASFPTPSAEAGLHGPERSSRQDAETPR
jgi:polysaccharide biosynthesis transport protein